MTLDLEMVLRLIPDYESLPNVLSPQKAAELTGFTAHSLAAFRCVGRHGIGFVRSGRKILYPKTEIAAFLVRNAVGIAVAE